MQSVKPVVSSHMSPSKFYSPNNWKYEGDKNSGQRHGLGILRTNDERGTVIEGDWFFDDPVGDMKMTYRHNGFQVNYRGPLKYNDGHFLQTGKGVMETVLPDGSVSAECSGKWYEGTLIKGKAIFGNVVYEGTFTEKGIANGNKYLLTPNKLMIYEGQFRDWKPDGYGKKYLNDGTEISGHWNDDYLNGEGTITYPNNDMYKGWIVGRSDQYQRHGKGTMYFQAGHTCIGSWKHDSPNTVMQMIYSDETKSKGMFNKQFQLHGPGEITFPTTVEARSFQGHFNCGKPIALGELTYRNGNSIQGHFDSDFQFIGGKGIMTWKEGWTYEGDINDDVPDGQGKFSKPGRFTYEGQIKKGLFHGQGTYIFENGFRFVGQFKNGEIDGPGVVHLNGFCYRHDKFTLAIVESLTFNGVITWGSGRYQGEISDGQPCGKGVLTWEGQVYYGPFGNGEGESKLPFTFPADNGRVCFS